jgi:hypothetical protein
MKIKSEHGSTTISGIYWWGRLRLLFAWFVLTLLKFGSIETWSPGVGAKGLNIVKCLMLFTACSVWLLTTINFWGWVVTKVNSNLLGSQWDMCCQDHSGTCAVKLRCEHFKDWWCVLLLIGTNNIAPIISKLKYITICWNGPLGWFRF